MNEDTLLKIINDRIKLLDSRIETLTEFIKIQNGIIIEMLKEVSRNFPKQLN